MVSYTPTVLSCGTQSRRCFLQIFLQTSNLTVKAGLLRYFPCNSVKYCGFYLTWAYRFIVGGGAVEAEEHIKPIGPS